MWSKQLFVEKKPYILSVMGKKLIFTRKLTHKRDTLVNVRDFAQPYLDTFQCQLREEFLLSDL